MSGFAIAEVVVDEGGEDIGRNIGDHTKANPAAALAALLHRGGDDGFILGGPTRFAGFRTADIALVDLDLAGQGLPIGPNHGGADLGGPGRCRLVAAEPELALQFGGRDTLLRRRHFEDGPEPQDERLLALFEDRPGDDRNLPATAGTLVDHPLRRREVGSVTRAVGAAEALRPFQPGQVLTTPAVSRAVGSHHHALAEPYVRLSPHTAPIVQPRPWSRLQWANRRGCRRATRSSHCRDRRRCRRRDLKNGFALSTGFLPPLVDPKQELNNAAPSVQLHYRAFTPTTGCSAPVPRLGTLVLTGASRLDFSLRIGATGSHVPRKSLVHSHAASMPDAVWAEIRTPPRLVPGNDIPPVSTSSIRFRHVISGSLALVSPDHT